MEIIRNFRLLIALTLFFAVFSARAEYASINGIDIYYETHGPSWGTPLVLLHGGYDDSDMWAVETALLGFRYRVIEIDSRGHGRSTDGNVPITYELMADDTLALLDQLNVSNAHFAGWSDGAVIGSYIAATRPERVNQLILFGAAFQGDAYIELFDLVLQDDLVFNLFVDSTFGVKYRNTNPEPEHWPVFRDKLRDLWQSPCYFADQSVANCLAPLESISVPTLVVAGDLEIIKRSHTEAVARAIPGSELKIVPLAGHFLPKFRPFLATGIIYDFLNN